MFVVVDGASCIEKVTFSVCSLEVVPSGVGVTFVLPRIFTLSDVPSLPWNHLDHGESII